jgi:CRISPR-associated endonuclease/helicase Cas3
LVLAYLAHSLPNQAEDSWHGLADHLIGTGRIAADRAGNFGASRLAVLSGELHDLGKYSEKFQRRVRGSCVKVSHATHGAVFCNNLKLQKLDDHFATSLAAFAIAGHHGGMPDWSGQIGLFERIKGPLEPLWKDWPSEVQVETTELWPKAFQFDQSDLFIKEYQVGFLGRMVFSCLVDGDWRDTEAFYDQANQIDRPRDWPQLNDRIDAACHQFDDFMVTKEAQSCKPAADKGTEAVRHLRKSVREHALARAVEPPGLFTLTVPTGGGKTLTSLGFALHHARYHKKRRIIYVIPYTSIIDQTAEQIRAVIGDDLVLEHHSATDFASAQDEDMAREKGLDWKMNLAMEDWAAPIIVTTAVQFFESLHSNRPSKCRKLHALANAVIVIDEAQTIPRGLLRPCVEAIRELARNYGATVVLCTATQPALDKQSFKYGLELQGRELAPDPQALSRDLRRVALHRAGSLNDDDLLTQLFATSQGLIIVNSRAHALLLYEAARERALDGLVHLTTRQRPIDRRDILKDIRQRLKDGLPCRLIATSLIEAGVDVDFPKVWRAISGLDQIAQAAGRCNREGKRPVSESLVTVFRPTDHKMPAELDALSKAFERVCDAFDDPFSPAAIQSYFEEVYWRDGNELDAMGFFQGSDRLFKINGRELNFSYRTCAERFKMIDDTQVPVFVSLDEEEAERALEQLEDWNARPGPALCTLARYSVPVYPSARQKLLDNGHVKYVAQQRFGDRFCRVVSSTIYSREAGLRWETSEALRTNDSIY